ncbi:MAG: hypothetical protein UZ19_OD1000074 [Parcubacteria bacterium OLB19]|nr:MAG: hypothetical protein UZ19_OD1000074 [Parcubacteria bacterium OLB19]
MVFDISSSTNPVYFANNDSSGSSYGTSLGGGLSTTGIYGLAISNNYLYVGKSSNSTACSQTAGSASGCELMVFNAIPSATLSGTMTGTSDFNNLTITGIATMSDNASTTNLTIATSSTLTAPSYLTIAGDLSNYGTYTHNNGTVILSGTSQDLVSPATTTFYNLTKSVSLDDTLTFTVGGTYVTEGELTLTGTAGNRLSLRSSSTTGEWYIDPQATTTVSYLDVQDSNNINVTTINCTTGCLDSDRNTNWTFNDPVNFVSTDDYHFYVGQATTTLDTITITKSSGVSDIVSANDMRITIATTTSNFRFETTNTTLTFGGTASGKVDSTVSYENAGATLVINVTSDFVNEDTLTISGIQVGSFNSVATSSGYLTLYTSGSISGTAVATDTKNIHITGSVNISNHTLDQVDNQFSFQNKNDEAMFAFNLSPSSENATVTDMVITLSGIQEVTSDEISDFKLYRDLDSDGALSGGDELLNDGGILTINGQHGAITFSTDFLATSTADYVVTFDTNDIDRGDSFVVSLSTSGVTAIGLTSTYSSYIVSSTVSNIQHERHGVGAGGSSGRIGDDAPAGNGIVTGGEEGGGGGVGEEEDGENIAHDPNFIKPSATGDIDNEWTNPSNALNSDGSYATAGSAALKQSYNGFSFGIPGGNTILGIEVKVDASGSTANGTIDVALSWDGGSSYTTGKATPTLSGTDIVYSVGGNGDTWGRSWTATEFNPTNFRLRVTANPSSNTLRLDALEVRVYHQSTGGGGGGGGGI